MRKLFFSLLITAALFTGNANAQDAVIAGKNIAIAETSNGKV